jgi:hypothetical protein
VGKIKQTQTLFTQSMRPRYADAFQEVASLSDQAEPLLSRETTEGFGLAHPKPFGIRS